MEVYNVTLFGHRDFYAYRNLEKDLPLILEGLFKEKEYINIFVGRDGEFDIFASSVVKRAQKIFEKEKLSLTLVLPYVKKDIDLFAKYYDDIIIPESIGRSHPKSAITKRNKWMIEKSDLLICYVEKNFGGAYNALKYAEKLGKKTINLSNFCNI